jgi:predicted amidohydrolase
MSIRVAAVQLSVPRDEPKSGRVERVAELVSSLESADLVVLPEAWNVGYFAFDRYADDAEPLDGDTVTAIRDAARAARAWVVAGSFVERDGDRLFNTTVLVDADGAIRETYRKVHLFGYRSQEQILLTPGERVAVADTPFGRLGLCTCYDLRFPELFRAMVDDGAELFAVPAAWPYPRIEAWTVLARARSIESQAWTIAVNCADEPGQGGCGRSSIVDPWGTVVASAGDRAEVLMAEIDPAAVRHARDTFPALRDRVLPLEGSVAR